MARCTRGESRSQPKIHSPRNVASSANAAMPSIASGAPNTPPTNFEYADQFMPNWNSWTRPVATPIAKLISSSVPKNFVSRSHASFPVRCHFGLHHRHQRREAERERDEQEVVDRRHPELDPREIDVGDGDERHGTAAGSRSGATSSSQSIFAMSARSSTCGPRAFVK